MCIISSLFKPPKKQSVKRIYDQKYPLYKQLLEEIKYILVKMINEKQIEISTISGRVKDFDSFYNKIVRKEIKDDPFDRIDDIAGARIICLYRKDLEKIEELIENKFQLIKKDTLRNQTIDQFGYESDHYVIILPDTYRGERYDSIKTLKCEIQVRTVAMHAWATVSHHLDYKKRC